MKITYTCEVCGTKFEDYKSKARKVCSWSCRSRRTCTSRKIEDHSIFDNGLTPESAYILGLIYSDGCLSYDDHTHRWRITIAMNDEELMNQVREMMTPNKKLYAYKHPNGRSTTYSVVSTNPTDIKFIQSMGVCPQKSLIIKLPELPEDMYPHFIRGVFDGDGSIYKYRVSRGGDYYGISFTTGSKDFADALCKFLNEYVTLRAKVNKDCRKDTWYVKIGSRGDVDRFFNYVYHNATIFMKRKHEKFPAII